MENGSSSNTEMASILKRLAYIIKILLEQYADVNITRDGTTFLHQLCSIGNLELVELFLIVNIEGITLAVNGEIWVRLDHQEGRKDSCSTLISVLETKSPLLCNLIQLCKAVLRKESSKKVQIL